MICSIVVQKNRQVAKMTTVAQMGVLVHKSLTCIVANDSVIVGSFCINTDEPCNHELSVVVVVIMCRCRHHLWTVLLATGLITGTHILHTYVHMPLVCAHELVNTTFILLMAAILANFFMWLS